MNYINTINCTKYINCTHKYNALHKSLNYPARSLSESAKMTPEVTSDSMLQTTALRTALLKTPCILKSGRQVGQK